ncbi:hypothetical protein [Youxingia wuxianensis]|uniref:TM2 domain-containing protein n=1 Tax=Youxingia wuxianensis TaxID=2763678 RepID=A0A926EPF8_9FIRM|nr:hypothetical protein [Youxingia wuxianensis]MBC8584149.1 hypothetical protein [Youxingia wuxianensis]
MKKSSFWTFILAFMPGAAHMYLGMMKKGVLLMTAFFLLIAVGGMILPPGLFLLPVIWFYCFFDALNMRHVSDEERKVLDENFVVKLDTIVIKTDWKQFLTKRHLVLGIIFIFIGFYMIIERVLGAFLFQYDWVWEIFHRLPTLIISFAIIFFGIYLIRGKKQPVKTEEDFVEFKGEEHE